MRRFLSASLRFLKAGLSSEALPSQVHRNGSEHRLRHARRHRLACVASLSLALLASPAWALDGAAITTDGTSAGAPACASCHGTHGEGNAESGFPRLAGLDAAYLVHQLASFVDGTRKNDIMQPIAKALTPQEREAVAAFYTSQQVTAAPNAGAPDAKLIARGAEFAINGDWQHGIPGCGQCHGPSGQGVGTAFPRLAGQTASYIASQIAAWQDGNRANDPQHLMSGVAHKLSEDEVKAVAAYYASLNDASKDSAHE